MEFLNWEGKSKMEKEGELIIEVTREEYEELINAIEVAMSSAMEFEEILLPLRERLFAEHGKPTWWRE
jgi:uncharacterized protein involved in tolerance to divalent cations